MKFPTPLVLAAALGVSASAFASTIITFDSGAQTNVDIPATFGDNVTASTSDFTTAAGTYGVVGTPNIDLTWSSSGASGGNSGNWQFYGSSSYYLSTAGALQLDGGVTGSTFSVLFTPGSQAAVKLNSFNFNNDTSSSPANRDYFYTVNVVDTTTLSTVFTTSLTFNPSVNTTITSAAVNINTLGVAGHALRLDIIRNASGTATSGASAGAANDVYIDNLSFDQTVAAVPEPSAYGVMGAGALGVVALVRRRRKRA